MYFAEYPIIPAEINLPLQPAGVGKCSSQCRITRQNGFNLHMVFYTRKGSGRLFYLGQEYCLSRGDIIILNKDIPYEYIPDDEHWHTSWITFSGAFAAETLSAFRLDGGKVIHYENPEPVNDMFRKMMGILKQQEHDWIYTSSALLYSLLTELSVHSADMSGEQGITDDEGYLGRAFEFINENFRRDITLEEVASAAGVTPEYFCRIFRRRMNMRPFEYVAKMRVQEAKKLLETTSVPVSEIGCAVGYHDKSYFGSVFKKYEGISPSAFRGVK
ncbi:MAG: AraC family transcriptional regulator [Oscillospiraceae bacterium]|nr:AraC family transcriptional regulator [Oscillospiraceae bacterium]